jgi:putative hydrolase of the HAD superfamily
MRGLLFDLDNTVYDTKKQVVHARMVAVRAMIKKGLQTDEKTAIRLLQEIVAESGSNYGQHYDLLAERAGCKNVSRIVASGVLAYHDAKRKFLKPRPDIEKILKKLKKEGYNLGIVSNGIAVKQWQKLIALGIDTLFDTVVISEEAGYCKPDKRIFESALSNLGLDADDAFYVGDHYEKDIAGAKAAGIKTILFETEENQNEIARKGQEPDYRIHEFKEILNIIKEQKKEQKK